MSNETEEQQIAQLKKWWSENATSIIFGVAIGLAGVFGSKAWIGYQQGLSERAATIYAVMMQGLDAGNQQRVSERADTLITEYSSTPYASLAALALAKIQLQEGDLEQQRLDDAEVLLAQPRSTTAFDSLYDEVAGDIHSARGNAAAASESYQHALAATPANNPGYQLLQLKYESVRAGSDVTSEMSP